MTDYLDQDFPNSLDQCIEKFWSDNPELKKQVLRDWYAGGLITNHTNMSGLRAVTKWLDSDPQSYLTNEKEAASS